MQKLTICLLCICALALQSYAATNKIVCYYASWSYYRKLNGQFKVKDINPNLCTHLIYAFGSLNGNGEVTVLDQRLDITLGNIANFTNLRQINPNVKIMASIGGWSAGSTNFSQIVRNNTIRNNFTQNILNFVQTHNLDGIDIDWEYPNQRGGVPADIGNFSILISELRSLFNSSGYLLSAALAPTKREILLSYNNTVANISRNLDFMNLMIYNLHGTWENVTGHTGPLYPTAFDKYPELNVQACVNAWIEAGAQKEKLVLGINFFGKSFTLQNATDNSIGANITGSGSPGPYTNSSGTLAYYEVCEKLNQGWTEVWNDTQKIPYAYKDNQWVGYENSLSVTEKVKFAKANNLSGVMIWSIDGDDFRPICGTKNVLLTAINNEINTTP